MLARVSDAGQEKACSNERAKGGRKKDRGALKRWPCVGDICRFRSDVVWRLILRHELILTAMTLHGRQTVAGGALFLHESYQCVSEVDVPEDGQSSGQA